MIHVTPNCLAPPSPPLPPHSSDLQYYWVNSACIEHKVSFYVEYFGYVMFIQSLILIAIDSFWLNWDETKNRLKAFNDMVEEVVNSPVKRESINTSLTSAIKVYCVVSQFK